MLCVESYFFCAAQVSVLVIILLINPLTTNVSHHMETSQLICIANQLTGFYMMGTLVVNGLMWYFELIQIKMFALFSYYSHDSAVHESSKKRYGLWYGSEMQ